MFRMSENWKEYLPGHFVSDLGRLKRIWQKPDGELTEKFLKNPTANYAKINRLVKMSFDPLYKPFKKYWVIHIDGNKRNNRLENLRYVYSLVDVRANYALFHGKDKYNKIGTYTNWKSKIPHKRRMIYSDSEVRQIKRMIARGIRHSEISRIMKCSQQYVLAISRGETRSYIK